jgi:hypothetical protein
MEIKEPSKKERKQIVFNVSAEDHELIKKIAAENRMTMRTWIVNAMAHAIRRESADE